MRYAILLAVLLLAGCGGGPPQDFSALAACRKVGELFRDAGDGILTTAEFRTRLTEIRRDSDASSDPAVRDGVRRVLAAFTGTDTSGVAEHTAALALACRTHLQADAAR